jgi:hypothetical protein
LASTSILFWAVFLLPLQTKNVTKKRTFYYQSTHQNFTYRYAQAQQFYIFVTVLPSTLSPRRYVDQHICATEYDSRMSYSKSQNS